MVLEAEREERIERLREQAFLAWQMACIWGGKLAPPLDEWLDRLGLGDEPDARAAEETAHLRRAALETAEKIVQLDRRRARG